MKLSLATFQFKDNRGSYRVDYYPIGPCEYRITVMKDGITRTEKTATGRQVVSTFNAKTQVDELKKADDEKAKTQ